jgi:1,4-dihydroxy-2-naphthoyl-CoA hydrolase
VTTAPPAWAPTGTISPLDDKLGIEIVDYDPERVVATMPVAGNQQPYGLLHGGATCALVETVGSWAAALHAGPQQKVVGIELNASYIRSATSGVVTAVCTPVRRGRTLATFLIEVTDDQGRPTASARLTCMVLPSDS